MSLKLDFSSAEKQRKRITAAQQKAIQKLYEDAAKDIKKQANKAPRVPSDSVKKQYLKSLEKQLVEQLTKVNNEIEGSIKDNMRSIADSVVSCNKEFLSTVGLTAEGAFSRVPDSVVRSVASGQLYSGNWTLSKAIWNTNRSIQRDVQTIVAQGIAENKSAFDIAKDLEMYVDPAAKKPWDWSKVYPGVHKQIDYNAQRLARTMVSHAYQQAFVQTTKNNPFVTKYRWLSSGGERVCEICESRNGVEYDKDDLPLDHPNGMCTFVAVMESSMTDIADRLADWVEGKSDPELDKYIQSVYPLSQNMSKSKLIKTAIGKPSIPVNISRKEIVEQFYEAADWVQNMFNVPVDNLILGVDTKNPAFTSRHLAYYYARDRKIHVNPRHYMLMNPGVFVHEIIHALSAYLSQPDLSKQGVSAMGESILTAAYQTQQQGSLDKSTLIRLTTSYGGTNYEEGFAEAMENLHDGINKNWFLDAIVEETKRRLDLNGIR